MIILVEFYLHDARYGDGNDHYTASSFGTHGSEIPTVQSQLDSNTWYYIPLQTLRRYMFKYLNM